MATATRTTTRCRLFDLGGDLLLGHRPCKSGDRGTRRRHQHRDRRGGPWIDLKVREKVLFRLVGGVQHHDLRRLAVPRIGLERLDALHRLLAELRLAILHAEQDHVLVLNDLHALGRAGADERLLQLGLLKLFGEGAGGSPGRSDGQHQRHGSPAHAELVHDRLLGGIRHVDGKPVGPVGSSLPWPPERRRSWRRYARLVLRRRR